MRLRLMLALMLVGVLACFTQSAAGSVPVPNGDMEKGQDGPEGWTWAAGDGGKGEFAWETGIAHSGRRSFRVKKIGSVGYTILSSDFVPVQEGKTYQISAWIYPVQPVQGGVYFMISQYPKDSNTWDLPNTFGSTTETFVAGQWQQVKVSVTIREGNSRIKIHCVQGLSWPSEVYWDDFEVTEVGEIPQARYEPPAPEPLPSFEQIKEAWSIVAKRPRATAKVEVRNGRPQLMIDGKPTPWAFYVSPFWNPQDAQIADFRNAGVRVYLVPLVLGNQVYGNRGPWKGRNLYDFSEVDELLWRVLSVDPEGYILFYLACDPYREWGAENPDHVTQDQNGKKAIVQMHPKRWGDDPVPPERFGPSPVSLKLRADVAAALRELVKYVESSEPGKAVIGYHIGGFNDGQWFHWASFDEKDPHLADYCPGAQESFREWLKRRYGGDVTALRKAWNQPQVTFESAKVPPFERYWAEGNLLDPATQQDIADYTAFYSEGVAETVMYLADVIKEASPRPVICGTYYEDISGNSPNHIALSRYLASSSLDYLAGPAAYGIRMAGYQGAVRSVFGSTLLHGKVFLTEQDWRSWLSYPDTPENNFAHGRAENVEVHNAMVRRECGMMLAFGLGTWWYDMGGGWFRDDQIMAGIAEAMRAFNRDLDIGGLPRADLAVFVSEESDHYVAPRSGGRFRYYGIVSQIHELNKAGVPYSKTLSPHMENYPALANWNWRRALGWAKSLCTSTVSRPSLILIRVEYWINVSTMLPKVSSESEGSNTFRSSTRI